MTLREILAMPALRQGEPEVVAGGDLLDREVEWVQTTEVTDAALLREGDLVLTTGIAMPADDAGLAVVGQSLAAAGVAGLVVELGRRWTEVPLVLLDTCREHEVPVVALHREIRFSAVTQVVCELLVEANVSELREHRRIDAIFTDLSLREATPEEIIAAARRLTAASVALESDAHELLLFVEGPDGGQEFIADWSWRSRRTALESRTSWDSSNGWLLTRLGRADRPWGRLVLQCPTPPRRRETLVLERAAAALAMHRVHGPDRPSQVRRRHQDAIAALAAGGAGTEVRRQLAVLGVPTAGTTFVGLAIAPATAAGTGIDAGCAVDLHDVVRAVLRAGELVNAHVLAGRIDGHVKVLVGVPRGRSADGVVDRLHAAVAERLGVVTGAGSPVTELSLVETTMQEAALVLGGARGAAGQEVQRLSSLRVRGLLGLMCGDDRLRTFAQRQLAPLREPLHARGRDLEHTLEVLLEEWGSKSAAASRLNISRSVLYERIERIQRLIAGRLDDPEVRTSLHLALLWSGMNNERTSA